MFAPEPPPTLHRRSFELSSILSVSPYPRTAVKGKKIIKKSLVPTCDWRVVVGVLSDPLVLATLLAVHGEKLEDIW